MTKLISTVTRKKLLQSDEQRPVRKSPSLKFAIHNSVTINYKKKILSFISTIGHTVKNFVYIKIEEETYDTKALPQIRFKIV